MSALVLHTPQVVHATQEEEDVTITTLALSSLVTCL